MSTTTVVNKGGALSGLSLPTPKTLRDVVLAACAATKKALADIQTHLKANAGPAPATANVDGKEDDAKPTNDISISSFLAESLNRATLAVEKLEDLLKESGDGTDESNESASRALQVPLMALNEALAYAQQAVANLEEQLKIADEKYKVSKTVKTFVQTAQERAEEELAKAKARVEEAANNLQDVLKMYGLRLSQSALDFASSQLKSLDSKYDVVNKIKNGINVAGETLEGLDKKYNIVENVKETYSNVDGKYKITEKAVNLVEIADSYTKGQATEVVALAKKGLENGKEFYTNVRKESIEAAQKEE